MDHSTTGGNIHIWFISILAWLRDQRTVSTSAVCTHLFHFYLFFPSNVKFAKPVVLSEMTTSLLCKSLASSVHSPCFTYGPCDRSVSPWWPFLLLLNRFSCPKSCSTCRNPLTKSHFCYWKDLLLCAAQRITQQTLIRLFQCKETQPFIQRPFFNMAYRKDRSFKIVVSYDTIISSLLFAGIKCFLGTHKPTSKSAMTVQTAQWKKDHLLLWSWVFSPFLLFNKEDTCWSSLFLYSSVSLLCIFFPYRAINWEARIVWWKLTGTFPKASVVTAKELEWTMFATDCNHSFPAGTISKANRCKSTILFLFFNYQCS